MKKYASGLIWSQIFLQTFLPLSPIIVSHSVAAQPRALFSVDGQDTAPASPFSADRNDTSAQQKTVLPYSSAMRQGAQILASGNVSDSARSLAVGTVSGEFQQWLSQFGTARIQLDMDRYGHWNHSSGDLLVPLYDNQRSLLFAQGGIRKPSDRLTANLGLGVRTFWQNGWMTGGNVFFDEDFTGHNRRAGFGAEAWRDYLRLSANTYVGTTSWHRSRDFDGHWQEKPADGYDLRVQGWLPAYPQLGAKLVWEQYYGSQVALFNKDNLQRNPYAVTTGVEYTPLPLVTLGANQKQGRGGHDTHLSLGLQWRFGQDWRWQTDPANVQIMRTLAGNRHDLVDRNNEIVLQYRRSPEQAVAHLAITVVTDNSPADGITRNVLQVLATNRDGQPVHNAPLNWNVPQDGSINLTASSSATSDSGLVSVTLTSTKEQTVPVTVQSGKVSSSQNSHFLAVTVSHIALAVTQDNAVADGSSTNRVTATLTDSNGRPVTGQKVDWTVPESVTIRENSSASDTSGKSTVHLTSTTAGSVAVSASAGSQTMHGTVHFTGNAASAKISRTIVTTDGSPADGRASNVAQVTVTDENGNTLPGQTVTWKADRSTVSLGQSAVTDASGQTTVTFTDTTAGSLMLTASLANGNSSTVQSLFVSDLNTARLDLTVTSGAKASGSDPNTATVSVADANGNALANTTVTFSVTGDAKLSSSTVSTSTSGKAQITLTSLHAGTVQVTARLAGGSSMTRDCRFVVDLDSTSLMMTATTGALADGSATNTAVATLKDRDGNPLSEQVLTMEASGSAKLSVTTGTTDSNGQVMTTLSDGAEETITVTASLSNGKQATTEVAFIGFSVTDLKTSSAIVRADGVTSATLTAMVKDANGLAVANTPVTFTPTGSAKLNNTLVTTNDSGQAQVMLTDDVGETVVVTAKANKSSNDTGKTIQVTFVANNITDIAVNGTAVTHRRSFAADSGFPETGFSGASFTLNLNNSTTPASDYTWRSSQDWVAVSNGVVTFSGTPSSGTRNVIISATPKTGSGTLSWSFALTHWFTFSSGTMSAAGADSYCAAQGQSVPSKDLLDYTDYGLTRVGSLWSEWADSLPSNSSSAVWASETGRYSRYYMFLYDGHIYDNASNHSFGAACVTRL